MKTPMNLLDRLNGIYPSKSEVPINWLVVAGCDTLDLYPPFLRRALLERSTTEAFEPRLRPIEFQKLLGRVFSGLESLAPALNVKSADVSCV